MVSPAHVPVPLGEAPEEAAEADGHGLLEVARVLRRVRRRSLLPLLRLVRVVDDGVAVWNVKTPNFESIHLLLLSFNLPKGVP